MIRRLIQGCLLAAFLTSAHGQSPSMLEYVKAQALEADRAFKANPDPSVVSARAVADGKAIVYTLVINFTWNFNDARTDMWRRATWSEVIPPACSLIRRNPYYQEGLQLLYRYVDMQGQLWGEFSANKNVCAKL